MSIAIERCRISDSSEGVFHVKINELRPFDECKVSNRRKNVLVEK